jgi:hypothetical protein
VSGHRENKTGTLVDLREGFRVEVEALVLPAGEYGARLYAPRTSASGRTTWKQAGPMLVAGTPEKAAKDLLAAMNTGLLTGVEVRG